uniref:Ribonuclease H n=1 Tax=Globisporangium ultimum (strain ATCC 200006 / CBS 805.95 / DAOM BR144) TaxID=431595 RepID=K3WDB6_GLOUD
MGGTKYYAVVNGRFSTGIFTTWEETAKQVIGFSGAKYKSFPTYQEAKEYYLANGGAAEDVEDLLQKKMKELTVNSEDPASTLVAFCGCSAHGNGTLNCEAAWACVFPNHSEWNVTKKMDDDEKPTNNRPVYLAALEALRRANVEDPERDQVLTVFTNLEILVDSMTKLAKEWEENNWVKSDGKLAKNVDLLKLLLDEQKNRQVQWKHVESEWELSCMDIAKELAQNAVHGSGQFSSDE